ncbi:MAG: hypothetical protein HYZ53_14855 [Planctomycetes bacterium]|nr:hypothetical protein [Planctomycetota bacterium]
MWKDNSLRWNGTADPHYEAWYLTLYDPRGGRAIWLRYTILVPDGGAGRGEAGVWLFAFDADAPDRRVAEKRIRPLSELKAETDPLVFRLGEDVFSEGRTTGSVDGPRGPLSWDLSFRPCPGTYHHLHGLLRALHVSKATVCAPNLDTRFHGEVRLGGTTVRVEGWPGQQAHVWGTRYAPGWIWAHANAFEGKDGTVFEGVSSRIPLGGKPSPPLTSLFFLDSGTERAWRSPRHLLGTRSSLWIPGLGGYPGVPVGREGMARPSVPLSAPLPPGVEAFSSAPSGGNGTAAAGPGERAGTSGTSPSGPGVRDSGFIAALFPPGFDEIPDADRMLVWFTRATGWSEALTAMVLAHPRDLVGVEHLGPTGEQRFCYNSEIASAILRLEGRSFPGAAWTPKGQWAAKRTASLEVVLSAPIPGFSIHLPHAAGMARAVAP